MERKECLEEVVGRLETGEFDVHAVGVEVTQAEN